MQEWKQAYSLAKLELRMSKFGFLSAFLFSMFILFFIVTSIESYMENGFVGIDFFFVLLFSVATIWTKPKEFQIKKVSGDLIVLPLVVMQKQLPIKQDVIMKSRFIVHFFYSFPFQLLALIGIYFMSPLPEMLSVGSFIAFAIIWLSFGVYAGYVFPLSEIGTKGPLTSTVGTIFIGVTLLIVLLSIFTMIHVLFENGIVYWSIILAQKWPIVSSIASILLAFFGFAHWQHYMKKAMDKLDYL
ncbi:hypothetical protein QGM71_11465 [Virgibacillus sp. C22-A2]|uniref:Uncharacterized protein n=1 Tax=Virgibacillus tibetensis TaxID=3042313 RepID=A0ABU6KGT5_9BACI|nr:hypothetical protein [Virgibacillus sp. C22-A2]